MANIYGYRHRRKLFPKDVTTFFLFFSISSLLYDAKFHTYKYVKASFPLVIMLWNITVKGGQGGLSALRKYRGC
jgi:hypothetical protein